MTDSLGTRPGIGGRSTYPAAIRILCAFAFLWLGCRPAPPRLRVFAAASLTEVVEELRAAYPGIEVATSYGASSALARQILDGAPADVFLSASPRWIEVLESAGALDGDSVLLARNRLVAIVPRGSPLAGLGLSDAAQLLARLDGDARVGIADEGVPAGEYARTALRAAGLLGAFTPRLVGQQDVRAVLVAVEQGQLAAGFVYATDARVAKVDVLFAFDTTSHPAIEYRAGAIRATPQLQEAHRFLVFLRDAAACRVLEAAGFSLP